VAFVSPGEKGSVKRVGEIKDVYAYREQYCGASQQNTANCFSLLWDKPMSVMCWKVMS
jgi:hypothetical protein